MPSSVQQNDPNNNHRFDVQKVEKLTVDYWRSHYSGSERPTVSQARKRIVKLLSGMQFGVNVVPVEKRTIVDAAGRVVDLTNEVRNNGVVMTLGNAGNTALTYFIRNGAPVCFDMSTGYCVTGVNPNWQSDEYKIIGTAMGEVEDGIQLVPIKFGSPASSGGTVNRMAVLQQALFKGKSASASLMKPVNQEEVENGTTQILKWGYDKTVTVWDFLMPYEDDYIDANVKIIVSQEPTSGLWVLNNPGCSPGGIETIDGVVDSAPIS